MKYLNWEIMNQYLGIIFSANLGATPRLISHKFYLTPSLNSNEAFPNGVGVEY